MKKKAFGIVAAIIVSICSFCGCNEKPKKELNSNEFYSVEEVYDAGWLTTEDLRSIAYYYNNNMGVEDIDENFTPKPKIPEALDENTKEQIKTTYFRDIIQSVNVSMDYINLYEYYGTYGEWIAVGITDSFYLYDYLIEPEYKIGDVMFYKYSSAFIRMWKK